MMPAVPKRRGTHHAVSNVPVRARTRRRRRRRPASGRRRGADHPLSDVRRWGGVRAPQARRDRGADVDDEWFVVVEDVEAGVLVVEERAEDRGGEEHDDRLVRERGSLERLASRGGGVVGRGGGERETRGRRASTSARAPEGVRDEVAADDHRRGRLRRRRPTGGWALVRRRAAPGRTGRRARDDGRDATRAAPRQRNRCGRELGVDLAGYIARGPASVGGVTGREDHERGAASSAPASHENEINKVLLRPRARAFHLSSFDEQRGGP